MNIFYFCSDLWLLAPENYFVSLCSLCLCGLISFLLTMNDHHTHDRTLEIQSLELMGIFLILFGIIIIIAAFIPMTLIEKMANAITGSLLTLIGILLIIKGRTYRKKEDRQIQKS